MPAAGCWLLSRSKVEMGEQQKGRAKPLQDSCGLTIRSGKAFPWIIGFRLQNTSHNVVVHAWYSRLQQHPFWGPDYFERQPFLRASTASGRHQKHPKTHMRLGSLFLAHSGAHQLPCLTPAKEWTAAGLVRRVRRIKWEIVTMQ